MIDARELIKIWKSYFGNAPVRSSDVASMLRDHGVQINGPTIQGQHRRLTHLLKRISHKKIDDCMIVTFKDDNGRRFRLLWGLR